MVVIVLANASTLSTLILISETFSIRSNSLYTFKATKQMHIYETIRTYAKQARGAMTRYILLHRLETPEEIIRFEWEGFQFNKEISDTERYIFTRAR